MYMFSYILMFGQHEIVLNLLKAKPISDLYAAGISSISNNNYSLTVY